MSREYNYPVWATQGGGKVREVKGVYIFVEKPDVPDLDVGDELPSEWDTIPANEAARQVDHDELYSESEFDHAMRDYVHRGPARQ